MMALTATAVPRIRQDIIESLGLINPLLYVGDFARPNLSFACQQKKSQAEVFHPLIEKISKKIENDGIAESIIVYVTTIKECDDLHVFLSEIVDKRITNLAGKFQVLKYHAKMTIPERDRMHVAFLTGRADNNMQSPLIVATTAFGMGIDKPDVREVLHWGAPTTLEAYYQQAGRAGRDGLPSTCQLYYNSHDFVTFKSSEFYRPSTMSAAHRQFLDASVDALRDYAETTTRCRQQMLVQWFGGKSGECGHCDNTINKSDQATRDLTQDALAILNQVQTWSTTTNKIAEALKNRGWKPAACQTNSTHKFTVQYLKEVLAKLKEEGYVTTEVKSMTQGTYNIGFEVEEKSNLKTFSIVEQGRREHFVN
jgi:ATP-dependent DNA helicase RecQ